MTPKRNTPQTHRDTQNIESKTVLAITFLCASVSLWPIGCSVFKQ